MKSLKESLFDSKTQTMESLFDKDLVEKDVTFGSQYIPSEVYITGDIRLTDKEWAEWLDDVIDIKKLKKMVDPYPAKQLQSYKDSPHVTEIACYFITLINQLPAITKQLAVGDEIFSEEIRDTIVKPFIYRYGGYSARYATLSKCYGNVMLFTIKFTGTKYIDGESYLDQRCFQIRFKEK